MGGAAINLEAVSGRGCCSRWVGHRRGCHRPADIYASIYRSAKWEGLLQACKTGVGGATAVFRAVQRRLEDREAVGVAV